MNSQTFGEKLNALRKSHGYSLEYVGEKIGYSPALLSKIEKNQRQAPQSIVPALATCYQISVQELMVKYLSELVFDQLKPFEFAQEVVETVQRRLQKEGKGTREVKSKSVIVAAIQSYFAQKPVEKAWLFGSFARQSSVSRDSDLDILVEFQQPNSLSIFDLVQMKAELTDRTGREVDLVEASQVLPAFKHSIFQERELVYGI